MGAKQRQIGSARTEKGERNDYLSVKLISQEKRTYCD